MGLQSSPFKRLGLPSDVADVVAFLVSEQARWLTGQVIQAGGGLVM
jgi:3-oxoacyl-[acyl-carrier protein] reductase